MTFAFVVILIAFCISVNFITVYGKPTTVQDLELLKNGQNITMSYYSPISLCVDLVCDMIAESIINSIRCSEEAGCHNGYCWAWCGVSLSGGEWCYTTKTHSQSYAYVECKDDSECNPCWKCAASCTL